MQDNPIAQNRTGIQHHTWKQLAVSADTTSLHDGYASMQMRAITNNAIFINACEGFHRGESANLRGR
jgi:hypothetical protein